MRDAEAVFAAQAIAAYEAVNPHGTKWTSLPPGEWGRWNAAVIAVLAVPSNQKDRLEELERQVAQLTAERDEWARKAQEWRHKYAELRYPGMTQEVKALDACGVLPSDGGQHD